MSSEHLAAIDIGTNSIHLVVARFGEGTNFEVIAARRRWSGSVRARAT